jgi:uncharacterized membrane protein YfcA
MDAIVQRNSKFRAAYWFLWGYLGFFIGYVVADILKEQMRPKLAASACVAVGFLVLYGFVPIVWPRIKWDRNKPPTVSQWIGIGVSLLWIGEGIWTWFIKR